jgi:hypothetical protein
MHLLAKSLLCASVTLLGATSASANVVGPGNYAGGFIGAVHSIIGNLSGVNYSVHPTLNGCNQGVTSIVNMVWSYSGVVTQIIPCHYVPGSNPAEEINPPPMSPERVIGGLQQTQELRDRYNIDAYERELHQLWRAEGEGSDGGH